MANHTGIVPSWLTLDYMKEKLKSLDQFKNYQFNNLNVSPGSKVGDNYACQIFRIRLNVTNNNKNEEISFIGKFLPITVLTESFQDEFNLNVFELEAHFLMQTLPEIKKRANSDFIPLCYIADYENCIMLMEDLVQKKYSMMDAEKNKFLSLEECLLAIEALATLHGASYSMVESNPKLKKIYEKAFWSSKKNAAMDKVFENSKEAFERFGKNYGLPENHYNALSKMVDKLRVDFCKVCDFQDGKFNVLLHGDSWKNNMMFKYEDGIATSIKLLDFQLPNYNSFANDLQYLIFSSVRSEIIVNHLDEILEKYYNKLISVDPEIPNLTLDRIKREFSERYEFGYILAFTFRSHVFSDVPMDVVALFDGAFLELGYNKPDFYSDLKLLMQFFEDKGVL